MRLFHGGTLALLALLLAGPALAVPRIIPGFIGGAISTPLTVPDGACGTTPTIAFTSEATLGWYRSAAGYMALCGGRLVLPAGTAPLPSLTWLTELDTGLYLQGLNAFGASTNGQLRFLFVDNHLRGGSATTIQFSSAVDPSTAVGDLWLQRGSASILHLTADGASAGAAIGGFEQTAPAAPAANGYRLYAQDNGAGKTQLCVIFASGVAQCFATQP